VYLAYRTAEAACSNSFFQFFGIAPRFRGGVGTVKRFRQLNPYVLVEVNCQHT
jgi:hypothetical protein